ncbi:MAG: exo-alpha-sialidase [Bacteroidaceae bacterium]|nr:exo-alpha-sialidase [Bacteroidaceae bacterium]
MRTYLTIITCALAITAGAQVRVFEYGSEGNEVCYRIPAIATAQNGDVISVADYRYCGSDIGYGRLSLHARISHDNGRTWGPIAVVAEAHEGKYGVNEAHDAEAGFGDPAIVADRESGNVLLLSCCGNVTYQVGTWEHHQGIARFRSADNGRTWSRYEDIAPAIYTMFKQAGVQPEALFVGSGRIFQSRTTKVGDYYRIYCVVLMRTKEMGGLNYVIYSDDFGETWAMLPGVGVTDGDEPKAEELPNGDIILSSRWWGRIFNIFHFADAAKAEGAWMEQAKSNLDNHGIVAEKNACNGEIMILPVTRCDDGKAMWLALQSVPFGPNRANVGIYFKGLATPADYSTPVRFATYWEGRHQVSNINSAYSTMTLQKDGTIGFLFEESTFGKDYTIVYKNLTIEGITSGAYRLR